MRPEPVRQNQVTLRVIQPVEDQEPSKTLRPIDPEVSSEERDVWGISPDPKMYEIQNRLAHYHLGVTPTTLNNWEKDFLSTTTPKYYVRNEAKKYRLAGIIELFVVQFRVSDSIVARVEDWDIALAHGLVEGECPSEDPRAILRTPAGRAILIPNRHPQEVEGWTADDIAKVKLNPYKCGAEQHLKDLCDRWEQYQEEKSATALSVSHSSATLAVQTFPTQQKPEGEVDAVLGELVESLAVWNEINADDPEEEDREIQASFKKGFKRGVKVRGSYYRGSAAGAQSVDELARQQKEEP